jgi:predicted ATPase
MIEMSEVMTPKPLTKKQLAELEKTGLRARRRGPETHPQVLDYARRRFDEGASPIVVSEELGMTSSNLFKLAGRYGQKVVRRYVMIEVPRKRKPKAKAEESPSEAPAT